ncbi:MAG: hypothetical protein J5654_09700 [Victivallales bacterium]|nr:hypothetical protein [Victivallales bacterium]
MANSELTSQQVATLVGEMKHYPYLVTFKSTELAPLSGPPEISPDVETRDVTLYETNGEVEASILTKNNVQVVIKTRDVDSAMTLMSKFTKNMNIMDGGTGGAAADIVGPLTLVPITSDSTAKAFTFPNAYLQPGLNVTPGENGKPSEASLTFLCKPATSGDDAGKPFTYAVAS